MSGEATADWRSSSRTAGCPGDSSWSTMRRCGGWPQARRSIRCEVVEGDGAPQVVLEIDEAGSATGELSGVGEVVAVGAGDLADGDGHRWMTC